MKFRLFLLFYSASLFFIYRLVDEFPRQEYSVNMFRCAEAASFHSPFSIQTRGSVTGDVTCPQLSGLYSDECCCSTNMLVVEV